MKSADFSNDLNSRFLCFFYLHDHKPQLPLMFSQMRVEMLITDSSAGCSILELDQQCI